MTTRDRDEVFLELTRSICPVCKRTIDAEVNARDNQVFLRKRCPEHGEFEARVYGDADMYVDIQRFSGTQLTYTGELGTDLWRAGELWGDLVARSWEAAVRATLASIKAEAERRSR